MTAPPSSVLFLGTGTAFQTDGRGAAALVVRASRDGSWLIDCGPTALAALGRFRVDTGKLDRLFVTHLHGDHIAGWPFLLLHQVFVEGRTRPFEVIGPRGVRDTLEGLVRLSYGDLIERHAAFEVEWCELDVAPIRRAAPAPAFEVVPVDHHPSSIGYRFDVEGTRIAVSGDTRWCAGVERLADGADLLILECTELTPGAAAHISLEELRAGVERLRSKRIYLVHTTDAVASALAADPLPRVETAWDGMEVPLTLGGPDA